MKYSDFYRTSTIKDTKGNTWEYGFVRVHNIFGSKSENVYRVTNSESHIDCWSLLRNGDPVDIKWLVESYDARHAMILQEIALLNGRQI